MSKKKIFVLNGHPRQDCFCKAIADHYADVSSQTGYETRQLNLADMKFNISLDGGYRDLQPLEPDLEAFWQHIEWCDHFVMVHPLWWGGMPAKLKGVFDRSFLPGKAFDPSKGSGFPEKLLKGRSARVIITSDTPKWYFNWGYSAAAFKQTGRQILGYCGFKPVSFTMFSPIQNSTDKQRVAWLKQVAAMARAGK